MKKVYRGISTISILILFIFVNCTLEIPVEEPEIIEKAAESITISAEEINKPMEVVVMDFTVSDFEKFSAYFQKGYRVFGIPVTALYSADLIEIEPVINIEDKQVQALFDNFFIKDGVLYFSISHSYQDEDDKTQTVTKYCKYEKSISYITKTKFPAVPTAEQVEGNTENYSIDTVEINDEIVSVVHREYNEPMHFVDGFIELTNGLLIHAKKGRMPSRPDGLLYWSNGKTTMDHWSEPGRFWK